MSVFTVVYFLHICYESHPSCYFDCAYIRVSEGDMRDDSIATIGSQFPIYIIIPVGLDSEKRIFSEKMRKERKKRGKEAKR